MADAVAEQPWLPDGPISTRVDYRMAGYERVSHRLARVPELEVVA